MFSLVANSADDSLNKIEQSLNFIKNFKTEILDYNPTEEIFDFKQMLIRRVTSVEYDFHQVATVLKTLANQNKSLLDNYDQIEGNKNKFGNKILQLERENLDLTEKSADLSKILNAANHMNVEKDSYIDELLDKVRFLSKKLANSENIIENLETTNNLLETKVTALRSSTGFSNFDDSNAANNNNNNESSNKSNNYNNKSLRNSKPSQISDLLITIYQSENLFQELTKKYGKDLIDRLTSKDVDDQLLESVLQDVAGNDSNDNNSGNSKNYNSSIMELDNSNGDNYNYSASNFRQNQSLLQAKRSKSPGSYPVSRKPFNNFTRSHANYFDEKFQHGGESKIWPSKSIATTVSALTNINMKAGKSRVDFEANRKVYNYRESPYGWQSCQEFFNNKN